MPVEWRPKDHSYRCSLSLTIVKAEAPLSCPADMLQDGEQMLIASGNAAQATSRMDVSQLNVVRKLEKGIRIGGRCLGECVSLYYGPSHLLLYLLMSMPHRMRWLCSGWRSGW